MYSPLPPSPLRVPMGLESWADSDFRMAFGVASALADTGDRGKAVGEEVLTVQRNSPWCGTSCT